MDDKLRQIVTEAMTRQNSIAFVMSAREMEMFKQLIVNSPQLYKEEPALTVEADLRKKLTETVNDFLRMHKHNLNELIEAEL